MKKSTPAQKPGRGFFLRFWATTRTLGTIILVLAIVASLPLFVVWKQVYVREKAVQRQTLADNCAQANSQIVRMRLACESLAQTRRIESIARARGLEYPAASRIVFITTEPEKKVSPAKTGGFFVLKRRPFYQTKG